MSDRKFDHCANTLSQTRRNFIRISSLMFAASISKTITQEAHAGESSAMLHEKSDSEAATAARAARHAKKIASPQWHDGKFRNGLPETTNFTEAFGKMLSSRQTTPTTPIPTISRKSSDFDMPPMSGLRVTWIGHSTLLVEIEGKRFLTDPIWGERASPLSFVGPKRFFPAPLPLNELPTIDAVVISHDHYDHFCTSTLETLAKRKVPFVVPLGLGDRLEKLGVHYSHIKELDWWEEFKIGEITLACVPARHFSGRTPFDRNSTLWCGWAFLGKSRRFYFSGDTAYFPGFKKIGEKYGPFDIAAIESAAYNSAWPDVHIGPEQAVQACLDVQGKLYLPIHWATFNLSTHSWIEPGERLMVRAKQLNVPLVLPRPGESVDPGALQESLFKKWWPELPWETADQAPVNSTGL
jgi:L-ascorbate metabolism protein UlaG (beta-lactamase superfamily)